MYPPTRLSFYLSYLSICLSVCLSVYLSLNTFSYISKINFNIVLPSLPRSTTYVYPPVSFCDHIFECASHSSVSQPSRPHGCRWRVVVLHPLAIHVFRPFCPLVACPSYVQIFFSVIFLPAHPQSEFFLQAEARIYSHTKQGIEDESSQTDPCIIHWPDVVSTACVM
jgi:hypothetical protein